ncbi:MAG: hypothetical protein CM1200mP41_02210 [Gammaproteobacteria bacterium]|nr:MAG: hypothetical protein CM1200mP41_02210 [Gammaproteobacteria bacterium]
MIPTKNNWAAHFAQHSPMSLSFCPVKYFQKYASLNKPSTTAVCAYFGPILESYLRTLESALDGLGLPQLHVMGSTGGVFDVNEALRMPVNSIESGPAAGVIAAQLVGRQLNQLDLLSFDMGGTTAKASLIRDGQIEVTAEYEVGGSGSQNRWVSGTGHPIRVPVIDLAEVSPGGGSIAWIDPAGALGLAHIVPVPNLVQYVMGKVEQTLRGLTPTSYWVI